ncbi:MAG TPA: 2-succinyl-5-enolpyruvyl-6-hydroxy-3-cyclohexene-1-carboxylic-acid synthase [Jiangellaceae bacterium]
MNPSTALARVLVDELVRNGVTAVVLAPGSRSGPLAFALRAADAAGRLSLHVRIDERSAGFLAVGLARSAGIAAVVTTSGTAVANLHPAVLEAHHGGVPFVVISADRPGELRGVGANQTIEQSRIFGTSVRYDHEIAAPESRTGQVAYWRSTVSRAVLAARGRPAGEPGPVHLNVALREPLTPDGDETWVEPLDGREADRPWTDARVHPQPARLPDLGARTLVVIGDASEIAQQAAIRLGGHRGWPVLAEPMARGGSVDVIDCAPLVAAAESWVQQHLPDRILVVGRPTLARSIMRLLRGDIAPVDVVTSSSAWADVGYAARRVLPAEALLDVHGQPGDPGFLAAWRKAGELARAAVDAVLDDDDTASGLGVARAVVRGLAAEAQVFLGSSSVVRDVDLVGGTLPRYVYANRGVAGIDGTVSSAIGAALGRPGVPAYALVGDLTFLHDANGLVIGPGEVRPDLCIVVVNDNGAGIFGLLEQGAPEHRSTFERVFGTPHDVDLAALCAATGTPHEGIGIDSLAATLVPRPGIRVVEVPADRQNHRELHVRLRAAVAEALNR